MNFKELMDLIVLLLLNPGNPQCPTENFFWVYEVKELKIQSAEIISHPLLSPVSLLAIYTCMKKKIYEVETTKQQ